MKKLITILMILISFAGFSQSFSELKIRNTFYLDGQNLVSVITGDTIATVEWTRDFFDNSAYWTETGNYLYNLEDSIGIGTSTPTEKFEVDGNAKVNNILLVDTVQAIGDTTYIENDLRLSNGAWFPEWNIKPFNERLYITNDAAFPLTDYLKFQDDQILTQAGTSDNYSLINASLLDGYGYWYMEAASNTNFDAQIRGGFSDGVVQSYTDLTNDETETILDSTKFDVQFKNVSKFQVTSDTTFTDNTLKTSYPALKKEIAQFHRVDSINTSTANEWVTVKWDTKVANESTTGHDFSDDSTYFLIGYDGVVRVQGCAHYLWEGSDATSSKIYVRVTVNSVEQRCSQANETKEKNNNDEGTIPFTGTFAASVGDTVRVQYYVTDTDLNWWGDTVFDRPTAWSVNFEKMSEKP